MKTNNSHDTKNEICENILHETLVKCVFWQMLFAMILSLSTAFAQTIRSGDDILTIWEAESIAAAQNPSVINAFQQYKKSEAMYLSAWSQFMPDLSGSMSWRRYDRDMLSFRNETLVRTRNNYSFGLSGSFPIFSGGKDYISLQQAKLNKDAQWIAYLDARAKSSYDVVSAYLSLAEAIMQENIAKQSLERILDEQKIVEQKFSLGKASEMEVSKMRVQVAQRQLSEIQAKNLVIRQREQLCALLDFPLDTIFQIDPLSAPPPEETLPPLEQILSQQRNRSLAQAQKNLQSARLQKLSSWFNYMPRISFSAGWNWSGGQLPESFSMMTDEGSFSYGLSLSWTIFSGTSRIADVMNSKASELQLSIGVKQAKISAEQGIREAYRGILEALASYKLYDAQVSDAKLTLSAARKQYEIGVSTLIELLDAELALEQAQLQHISALANYHRAKTQLRWLMGEQE